MLTVGLGDLKGLFQPKSFYNSMILLYDSMFLLYDFMILRCVNLFPLKEFAFPPHSRVLLQYLLSITFCHIVSL